MPVIAMNQEMGSQESLSPRNSPRNWAWRSCATRSSITWPRRCTCARARCNASSRARPVCSNAGGTDEGQPGAVQGRGDPRLAARGNVIIRGWGATHVLHPIPHIPCVRVGAPFATRVKWLMNRLDTDDEEMVSEEIRHSDVAHRANMQHQFGVTWGEAMQYDITLNTERLSVATCVELIKELLKRPEFKETPKSRAKLANLTLEYHVRAALRTHAKTADVKISISADDGKVTLEGIAAQHRGAPRHRREVVGHVPGVKGADSKLKAMKYAKMFPASKT